MERTGAAPVVWAATPANPAEPQLVPAAPLSGHLPQLKMRGLMVLDFVVRLFLSFVLFGMSVHCKQNPDYPGEAQCVFTHVVLMCF